MEGSKSSVGLLRVLVVVMGFMSASEAYDFSVGGRTGWVLNPSETLNQWAERNRFQVNDSLVFKYKKWEDSVLVVRKEGYEACNATDPIESLGGGDSVFKLDRSGPFFFISGAPGRCEKGQKMIVVVLAVRDRSQTPPPSSAPRSPSHPPSLPAAVPPSASPSAVPPSAHAPAPSTSSAPYPTSAASVSGASRVSLGLVALVLGGGAFLP